MSTRLVIPVGASLHAEYTCILPSGEHEGKRFFLRWWVGLASHGFRSGYERKPAAWLEYVIPQDSFRQAYGYSGSRLGKAEEYFAQTRADFEAACDQKAGACVG